MPAQCGQKYFHGDAGERKQSQSVGSRRCERTVRRPRPLRRAARADDLA